VKHGRDERTGGEPMNVTCGRPFGGVGIYIMKTTPHARL